MSPVQKIKISLTAFGAIVLAFIFLIIYPLFNEIKNKSEDLVYQERILAESRAKVEKLKELQILYNKYLPNLEKIDALFINSETPLDFIEFLEKTSDESHLFLEISPSASREIAGDPWLSMNFQLNLTSSFLNFLKFIEKLESSPYLIEILNMSLVRLTEADVKSKAFETFTIGDVTATLLIKVYAK